MWPVFQALLAFIYRVARLRLSPQLALWPCGTEPLVLVVPALRLSEGVAAPPRRPHRAGLQSCKDASSYPVSRQGN